MNRVMVETESVLLVHGAAPPQQPGAKGLDLTTHVYIPLLDSLLQQQDFDIPRESENENSWFCAQQSAHAL
jgi:hypothetical protein